VLTLQHVEEAAVVAIRTEGFEGWTICCGVVSADPDTGPTELAIALRDLLPPYMVPQRWAVYERLPTNPNGKIDRPRLRADFESSMRGTT